ncbi:MAG TPA: response regulator [Acidimicrobiales bacterium]|jgi:CheY-like chemotaxis protein|nr:response regulator [Acidimicrobiales bacterium]
MNKEDVVLVVDDDEMVRRLVRTVLEADDYKVVDARSGDEALALLDSTTPRVVVLDVMMPGLDGVEVCRQIDHSKIKVVMLTARDDPALEQACKDAGADAFLTKPFSSIRLLDVIEELGA